MLDLAVMYEAAKRIVTVGGNDYARTVAMAELALEVMKEAVSAGGICLPKREQRWLELIGEALSELPPSAGELMEKVATIWGELFLADEYGLR